MVKVIVLGKNGMLGSAFFSAFEKDNRFDITGYDRSDFDMTNFDRLGEVILDSSADFVINCVGYTAVDQCESDEDEAFLLNCDLCAKLAEFCNEAGSTLIHFSTDYVFDGENSNGYEEDALVDPINIYGESKLAGERLVVQNAGSHVIVRTSWLFGKCGKNFVDTIIGLAKTRKEIKVVDDQIGSPTYTADLAKAIFKLAEITMAKPVKDIYHISNNGKVSWYEYTRRILEYAHIADVKVTPITSEELDRPAKRPKMSALNNSRYQKTTHDKMRDYNEALQEYLIK